MTMKKNVNMLVLVMFVVLAGWAFSGTLFTAVTSEYGPSQNTQINAALDALEDNLDGTTPLASPVVKGTLTAISTNEVTTNVIIGVTGYVDASKITGDASALTSVTASSRIYGATGFGLSVSSYFTVVGTQLLYVAGSVTNVIDADLTTP